MNRAIKRGLQFVKNNPAIISSLGLIVVMVGIIFFNSYYILNKLQDNNDALLQKKAVLIEDILHIFIADSFANNTSVQQKVEEIKKKDSEIEEISILVRRAGSDRFWVSASTDAGNVGKEVVKNELYDLAWSNEKQGIAYLNNRGNTRFWDVAKVVMNGNVKIGLTIMKLSLQEHDNFITEKIKNVYAISTVSAIIVLLMVLNHANLFGYALKAQQLEEVDRMKDEFISMASHELKTPLTAMKGYIDLLQDSVKRGGASEIKDELHYLGNMNLSVDKLRQLIDDILDVSRIEQNRLALNMEKIDLRVALEKIYEEMDVIVKQKGLELAYAKNVLPLVMADPIRLEQVLVNLIGNAIKYTQAGKIEIMSKEDGGYVYLTVADTGLGISAEEINRLFDKFHRVRTDATAKISGTGLGLWISKQLAIKMGGDITIESIEGVGSHFILKLKKA